MSKPKPRRKPRTWRKKAGTISADALKVLRMKLGLPAQVRP